VMQLDKLSSVLGKAQGVFIMAGIFQPEHRQHMAVLRDEVNEVMVMIGDAILNYNKEAGNGV
jgi:nicotinamide mononucleotide adenylyltransferase